jgi:hypothetical protein
MVIWVLDVYDRAGVVDDSCCIVEARISQVGDVEFAVSTAGEENVGG